MTSAEFVNCDSLPPGSLLDVETKNRHYSIEYLGGGAIRISGHPEYCPTPAKGILLPAVIERGQHMQFLLSDRRPVTTSRVTRLRVQRPEPLPRTPSASQ